MNRSEKWHKSMLEKFGSEEAIKAEMKRRQEKSMLNPNRQKGVHKGGFSRMDKDTLKEVSKKGVIARGDEWRG